MPPQQEKISWYSRAELVVIYVLCTSLLVGLVIAYGQRQGWFSPTLELTRANPGDFDYHIDINSAHWTELTLLPNIGEVRANAIVQHRQTHGPFQDVSDLLAVPGISTIILARIRDHVTVGINPAAEADRRDCPGITPTENP